MPSDIIANLSFSATYSVTLDEELPENQTIAVVMATDSDAGSNKELYYTISSVVALNNIDDQSAVAGHFSVDPVTGLVVTNASLDFEFVQRYRITVTATDNGINQRSRYVNALNTFRYLTLSFICHTAQLPSL